MTVALVGAGPGDPGLMTLRGAALLGAAEVVLYDRLLDRALLDLVPDGAELIDVGKGPGQSGRQADINELLVTLGRSGRRVVRLKGGDPFVFGRGGEEAEALRNAGIDVEVVPGVTSAVAAPGAAGIPVTHRTVSTSFTVVTGHAGDPDLPGVNWGALARTGGTLVILMGMGRRAEIVQELLAAGRPIDEPVAVVRWGTTAEQEVVRTTLAGLPDVGLAAPATIVIGPVAALDVTGVVKADGRVADGPG
jgi:uroporphyrin-III C-methyltransferase